MRSVPIATLGTLSLINQLIPQTHPLCTSYSYASVFHHRQTAKADGNTVLLRKISQTGNIIFLEIGWMRRHEPYPSYAVDSGNSFNQGNKIPPAEVFTIIIDILAKRVISTAPLSTHMRTSSSMDSGSSIERGLE